LVTEVWRLWAAVLVVSGAGLLLAAGIALALAAGRIRHGVPRHTAWRHSIAEVGIVAGTLPWLWMIMTPNPGPSKIVTPLDGLRADFGHGAANAVMQVGGNLLVFAAFGFLAPVRWRIRPLAVLSIAAVASAILETSQYILDIGRIADFDDIILNAAGAGLAALCARRLSRRIDGNMTETGGPSIATHRYGEPSTQPIGSTDT